MATMTIRSTYALDTDTVKRLDDLAREWGVSKSEALRRAIREADAGRPATARLDALDRLQAGAALDRRMADRWIAQVRRERASRTPRR
jgi:hypothetical protein